MERFPGHVSIVSRVDHVITKETSRNRFSAVSWPSSTCMLISQRISFTPQCHDFYARDSQHYKLITWNEIGQSADMRRPRVAGEPDASTRAFTLQRQPDAYRSRPLRTTPMWSECTRRTRRSGRSVYTGNPTRTVRERFARRVKLRV